MSREKGNDEIYKLKLMISGGWEIRLKSQPVYVALRVPRGGMSMPKGIRRRERHKKGE